MMMEVPIIFGRTGITNVMSAQKLSMIRYGEMLEQRESHQWEKPLAKHLGESLIEILVRGNVQWRILGYYGPKGERKAFTILLICNHKQNRYQPHDAINTARKRLKMVEQNNSMVKSCDRPS